MLRLGSLLILLSALLSAELLRDDTNGVVIDSSGGLVWQDNSDAANSTLNWQSAITYCNELTLAGLSNWYLPTINELKSIVDANTTPSISTVFKNVASDGYWSASGYDNYPNHAQLIIFSNGANAVDNKSNAKYVRCVHQKNSASSSSLSSSSSTQSSSSSSAQSSVSLDGFTGTSPQNAQGATSSVVNGVSVITMPEKTTAEGNKLNTKIEYSSGATTTYSTITDASGKSITTKLTVPPNSTTLIDAEGNLKIVSPISKGYLEAVAKTDGSMLSKIVDSNGSTTQFSIPSGARLLADAIQNRVLISNEITSKGGAAFSFIRSDVASGAASLELITEDSRLISLERFASEQNSSFEFSNKSNLKALSSLEFDTLLHRFQSDRNFVLYDKQATQGSVSSTVLTPSNVDSSGSRVDFNGTDKISITTTNASFVETQSVDGQRTIRLTEGSATIVTDSGNNGYTMIKDTTYNIPPSTLQNSKMELKSGWNLLSSPIKEPLESSLFGNFEKIYTYDNNSQSWGSDTKPSRIEDGAAFWIYSNESQKTVTPSGTTHKPYLKSLKEEQWHLLGCGEELTRYEIESQRIGKSQKYFTYQGSWEENGDAIKPSFGFWIKPLSSLASSSSSPIYSSSSSSFASSSNATSSTSSVSSSGSLQSVTSSATFSSSSGVVSSLGGWMPPSESVCKSGGGFWDSPNCTANWDNGRTICINLGGRLPTQSELSSVYSGCSGSSGCINALGFTNSGANTYWSGDESNSTYSYKYRFLLGVAAAASKMEINGIKCRP